MMFEMYVLSAQIFHGNFYFSFQTVFIDESKFNMVMSTRSYAHLREVFSKYSEMFSNDVKEVIKTNFTGDLQDLLLAIADCAENIPAFQAEVHYFTEMCCV